MIKKTLISALIFLILHALFVNITQISNSQNQWQENIVKAQHFIYTDNDIKNIIVGSSLSNRLLMDSLKGFYNLSLLGQNIYDGLYILTKKNKIPNYIYLEMNIVLGKENNSFKSSLYSPILYNVRRIIPSLRDEYQPVGQISSIMMSLLNKIQPNSKLLQTPTINSNIFNKLLDIKINEYSKIPDEKVLIDRFSVIKRYVTELEKKGAQVIFFEMPVNEKLCNLPMASIIREYFYKTFPIDKYKYIPSPDCKSYITRDGIHLGPEEAIKYTRYFKAHL